MRNISIMSNSKRYYIGNYTLLKMKVNIGLEPNVELGIMFADRLEIVRKEV